MQLISKAITIWTQIINRLNLSSKSAWIATKTTSIMPTIILILIQVHLSFRIVTPISTITGLLRLKDFLWIKLFLLLIWWKTLFQWNSLLSRPIWILICHQGILFNSNSILNFYLFNNSNTNYQLGCNSSNTTRMSNSKRVSKNWPASLQKEQIHSSPVITTAEITIITIASPIFLAVLLISSLPLCLERLSQRYRARTHIYLTLSLQKNTDNNIKSLWLGWCFNKTVCKMKMNWTQTKTCFFWTSKFSKAMRITFLGAMLKWLSVDAMLCMLRREELRMLPMRIADNNSSSILRFCMQPTAIIKLLSKKEMSCIEEKWMLIENTKPSKYYLDWSLVIFGMLSLLCMIGWI